MIVRGQAGTRYPWEPITLAQQLALTAAEHPERDAVIGAGVRLTWAETQIEVLRVARALRAAGVGHGDHVAVSLPNRVEWVLLWLGANAIGAVLVAIDSECRQLEDALRLSDSRLLVIRGCDSGDVLARLRASDLPELCGVVFVGDAGSSTQSWPEFLEAGEFDLDLDVDEIGYDEPCLIVYPSDIDDGAAKGAVHSSRMLRNACSLAEVLGVDAGSRVLNHVPFSDAAGACTGVLPPLVSGAAMIVLDRWEPARALELIERERVTVFSGNATYFNALLNHPGIDAADVSSLESGWIGDANVLPELVQAVVARLGMQRVLPAYGRPETTAITTLARPADPFELIASGKGIPASDFELKIVDAETGAELDAGGEGEICVRGHIVMQGYYEDPEATAAVIDDEWWFHTGDLGVLDESGYLTVTGHHARHGTARQPDLERADDRSRLACARRRARAPLSE